MIRAVAKLPQKVDALADKATEAGTKRLEWARKQTEKALREVNKGAIDAAKEVDAGFKKKLKDIGDELSEAKRSLRVDLTGARAAKLQSDIVQREEARTADESLQEANQEAMNLEEAMKEEQKSGLDELRDSGSEGDMAIVDMRDDLARAEAHAGDALGSKIEQAERRVWALHSLHLKRKIFASCRLESIV